MRLFLFRFCRRIRDPGILPDVPQLRKAVRIVRELQHDADPVSLRCHLREPAFRIIIIFLVVFLAFIRAGPAFSLACTQAREFDPRIGTGPPLFKILPDADPLAERIVPGICLRKVHGYGHAP